MTKLIDMANLIDDMIKIVSYKKEIYFVDFGLSCRLGKNNILIHDWLNVILSIDVDFYRGVIQDYHQMDNNQFILTYGKDPFKTSVEDIPFDRIKKCLIGIKSKLGIIDG